MDSYFDNSAFVNSLGSNASNIGNSGGIDKGLVIVGGIVLVAGIGFLVYLNYQQRNNYHFELMRMKDKFESQTNEL